MTLIALVRYAVETAENDEDLAKKLADKDILDTILQRGTLNAQEVTALLGYGNDTLRVLAKRSKAFPPPVVTGKRWCVADIHTYQQKHARKTQNT